MAYLLSNINLKNTGNTSWRSIKITEDDTAIAQYGQLFCIAELIKSDDKKIKIVEELIDYVMTLFSEQDGFTSTRAEDLLEHILEEANREFTKMTNEIEPGDLTDFSCIIGIVKNENLVLSSHGKLEAWLLHPFAKKGKDASYRWVNILENTKKNGDSDSGKLFDQVIAGELSEKQSFVIGTKNLWRIFTQDKFKELIFANRSKRIKQIVVKTVDSLPTATDLSLLLGKDEMPGKKSAVTQKKEDPQDEVQDDEQEGSRERNRAIATLFGGDTKKQRTGDTRRMMPPSPNTKKLEQQTDSIAGHVEKRIVTSKNWFQRLSTKSKVLFVIALVLIVGSIQSFAWINSQNQEEKISVQFDEKLALIREKQDEAEAKLIYNDKVSARELIEEALGLTEELPERYQKEEEQKEQLASELTRTLREIDGLEQLPVLTEVFTFPQDITLTIVHEVIPLRAGTMIVITESPSAIVVDVEQKNAVSVPMSGIEGTLTDTSFNSETNTLYTLTDGNQLYEIPLGSLEATSESLATRQINTSIADIGDPSVISFYANNLYLVDTADRQVKKLVLANNAVSSWLSSPQTGLGAAIDIGIDGNIYIATQTGITQYFKGDLTGWAITGLTPSPSTIVAFHAALDDQYIYLLDNTTTRLIVLNQDGSLFRQFTSPQLISPADVTINESGKELYILDGRTIFRAPITWLTE